MERFGYSLKRDGRFLSELFAHNPAFDAVNVRDSFVLNSSQKAHEAAQKLCAEVVPVHKPRFPFGDFEVIMT